MDLYLLNRIVPLVQNVLGLEYLPEATLSNGADFLKKSMVPILLEVLAEFVVICRLLIPKDDRVMYVLSR